MHRVFCYFSLLILGESDNKKKVQYSKVQHSAHPMSEATKFTQIIQPDEEDSVELPEMSKATKAPATSKYSEIIKIPKHVQTLAYNMLVPGSNNKDKNLERILVDVLSNTSKLKFISHILRFNEEDDFSFENVNYTLLRVTNEESKLVLVYEVKTNESLRMNTEELHITEDLKLCSASSVNIECEIELTVDFLSHSDVSEIFAYFVLLLIRGICDNLFL